MNPELTAMAALVFALGLRHGFDPDHLVAIDGLTRSTKSRWCGLFFSVGHGVAVTLIGVGVALAATEWQAPAWLEQAGASISIGVLLVLGVANLLAVLRAPAGARVALVGLRGPWLTQRLAGASHPAVIASIGAAFALSLDTISHALLFSLSGWMLAALLGATFTLGMLATDFANGLWVAKMMAGAAAASRWMSAAVASLCLLIAAVGLLKHAAPALDRLAAPLSVPLSIATLLLITAIAAIAARRSRSAIRQAGT